MDIDYAKKLNVKENKIEGLIKFKNMISITKNMRETPKKERKKKINIDIFVTWIIMTQKNAILARRTRIANLINTTMKIKRVIMKITTEIKNITTEDILVRKWC